MLNRRGRTVAALSLVIASSLGVHVPASSKGLPSPADASMTLTVANYEYVWNYDLDLLRGTVALRSAPVKQGSSAGAHALGTVLRDLDARNIRRQGASGQLAVTARGSYNWADMSPDCTMAIAAKEGPHRGRVTHVAIIERLTGRIIKEIRTTDRTSIQDVGWSRESRFAVILESKERLVGFLTGIAGHPIPYDTLTASVIDFSTGAVKRLSIAKDVSYATGMLFGPDVSCPVP